MRIAIVFAATAAALLMSCCHRKTEAAAASASTAPPTAADGRSSGRVTTEFANEGCPVLVDRGEGVEQRFFIPIGLEPQFAKDGTKLSFVYRLSRASSGMCGKGQPAILEEIQILQ
jgi:hypothetical protein